jgi:hypothetical protein
LGRDLNLGTPFYEAGVVGYHSAAMLGRWVSFDWDLALFWIVLVN